MAIQLEEAIERLRDLPVRVARSQGLLLKILKRVAISDVQAAFNDSKDPDDKPWKPLTWPRVRGDMAKAKPLLNTGLLRASIAGGPNHVERTEGNSIVFGTNRVGANLMQFGGVVRPTGGRKFLAIPLTPEAARAVSPLNFPRPLSPIINGASGVLVEKKKRGDTAQYALRRSVTVPARPFLGIGQRLRDKLTLRATQFIADKANSTIDNGPGSPASGGEP